MALFRQTKPKPEKQENTPTTQNTGNDDDGGWIEIHDNTWNPTHKGDTIIGKLTQKNRQVGQYNNNLYILEDNNGKKTSIWGKKHLDVLMNEVQEGDTIKITYTDTVKTKEGNQMMTFKLAKKGGN